MKYRCRRRADYIALGVKVCDRWLSFKDFLADMGERPSVAHSIDRWPNNRGDYRPGNCRWATRSEQQQNKGPQPGQPNQYSSGKASPRVNECAHPERQHRAKGMCSACYQRKRIASVV